MLKELRTLAHLSAAITLAALAACGGNVPSDSTANTREGALAKSTPLPPKAKGGPSSKPGDGGTSGGTTTPPPSGTPTSSGLGINLLHPAYWSPEWTFINYFPIGGGWSTSCWEGEFNCSNLAPGTSPGDTKEQSKLNLDADGWVKSLPAANDPNVHYRRVGVSLFQGDGGSRPTGKWVILYDGKGRLGYEGAGKKNDAESTAGRDVIDVPAGNDLPLVITLHATDPADYIRNIRAIAPGGICTDAPLKHVPSADSCPAGNYKTLEALAPTQRYHPALLNDLKGFRTLRFMQWFNVNTTQVANWSDRTRVTEALWNYERPMPYEPMFELSAALGADPWINLPAMATDDHARQLGAMAKTYVAAPNVVYFEYGNEPWNWAYPYGVSGSYYETQARAKWPNATNTSPMQLRMNWYAYRATQLCQAFKSGFGDDARVKCVLGGQASSYPITELALKCDMASAELGGMCSKFANAVAIGPYFGHYVGNSAFATTLGQWAAEADGGVESMMREVTGKDASGNPVTPPLYKAYGSTPPNGAIAESKVWMSQIKQMASAHGLPMISYEDGQHLVSPQAEGTAVSRMFYAANRHPRMAGAFADHLANWKAAGGEVAVYFTYAGRPSWTGNWGFKEFQQDDSSAKWVAIKTARDQGCWWTNCAR